MIWNFKREEKKFAKRQIRTQVDLIYKSMTHILPSAPLELMIIWRPLLSWRAQSHVGGQS